MQRGGLRLQAREQVARALHRQALMIEAQAVEPAQLLAGAGAAGAAVIALRHDDAMPGMGAGNRRIDREDAAVARADLAHHAREKTAVLAIDGGDQRAPSPRHQYPGLDLIVIGYD